MGGLFHIQGFSDYVYVKSLGRLEINIVYSTLFEQVVVLCKKIELFFVQFDNTNVCEIYCDIKDFVV